MRFAVALFLCLSACTEFPELAGTLPSSGTAIAPPALVPLGPLMARAAATDRGGSVVASNVASRVSNLRARASRLRGPVIGATARAQMLRGVR